MPSDATPEAIAADIRAAHEKSPEEGARVLCSYFAEKVVFEPNVPEQPAGVIDGAQMLAVRETEFAASRRAFPDYDQHTEIEVVGNDLVCAFTMSGTPPDGERLEFTTNAVYTVENGEFTKVTMAFPDPAIATRLFGILAAAGFTMPDAESLR